MCCCPAHLSQAGRTTGGRDSACLNLTSRVCCRNTYVKGEKMVKWGVEWEWDQDEASQREKGSQGKRNLGKVIWMLTTISRSTNSQLLQANPNGCVRVFHRPVESTDCWAHWMTALVTAWHPQSSNTKSDRISFPSFSYSSPRYLPPPWAHRGKLFPALQQPGQRRVRKRLIVSWCDAWPSVVLIQYACRGESRCPSCAPNRRELEQLLICDSDSFRSFNGKFLYSSFQRVCIKATKVNMQR